MILAAIILATTIIVGVGTVLEFWNETLQWIKKSIVEIKKIISGILYGVKVFIKKITEGIVEISKNYSKDKENRWTETIIKRKVSESEVPEEVLRKARMNEEIDYTNELELQL